MSLFKISHTLFLKTILLRKECFTNTFLTSAELSVPASLPLKISNRLLLFNFTAQRATRNKVLYISYVFSQHMYLAEHKSTGKKLLVSFLKNITDVKISLWMNVYRHCDWQTEEQRPETLCDRHWGGTCNIATYEMSGNRASWIQCVLPRIFLNNPAILGQFPRTWKEISLCGSAAPSLPKAPARLCLPTGSSGWAALSGFLTAFRSQSCICSFSLLADKWVEKCPC